MPKKLDPAATVASTTGSAGALPCSQVTPVPAPSTASAGVLPPFVADFELDLMLALRVQLEEVLKDLTKASLADDAALDKLPDSPGVYRLFHHGKPAYVGKTDRSLRHRLKEHARDIDGRHNIQRTEIEFVCATVALTWSPVGPERALMRASKHKWQNSGFGNNDPGRERDTSRVKPDHWDAQHPIRLQWPCKSVLAGTYSVFELLEELKDALPFVLRYSKKQKQVLQTAQVKISNDSMEFWSLMKLIVDELPGWQATALPGYAILYKERRKYQSAIAVLRP